jgi:hypothetical protein
MTKLEKKKKNVALSPSEIATKLEKELFFVKGFFVREDSGNFPTRN